MDKPNVIVFFTDQQRWDTSGLHGNPLELMPNFDQMAMRGTHFFNTFIYRTAMVNIQIFNIVGLTCLNLSCRVKLIFHMALHAGIFVELWHSPQLIRNIKIFLNQYKKIKK